MGPVQVTGEHKPVERLVERLAEVITVLGRSVSGHWVVVISPEHQGHFLEEGWTKARLHAALYEQTVALYEAHGAHTGSLSGLACTDYGGDWRPIRTPEHLLLLKAGGGAGPMSVVIPPWGTGRSSSPVTVRVRGA
jgi:hypothetical protein